MRTLRVLLALAGAATLAWGGFLAAELALESTRNGIQGAAFLVAGPIVHDLVVAPIVGLTGLLIARRLPGQWVGPVAAGAVSTGVLAILALPLLWLPYGAPRNPGLHDRDYWLGLAVGIAVVWVAVLVAGLLRGRLTAASTRA